MLQDLKHQFRLGGVLKDLLRILSVWLFVFSAIWSGLMFTDSGRDVPSTPLKNAMIMAGSATSAGFVSGATILLADVRQAVTEPYMNGSIIADWATASLWDGFTTMVDSIVTTIDSYITSLWSAATTGVGSFITAVQNIVTAMGNSLDVSQEMTTPFESFQGPYFAFPPSSPSPSGTSPVVITNSPTQAQLFLAVQAYFQQGLSPELIMLLKGPKGDIGPRGLTTSIVNSGGGGTVSVPSDLSLQTLIVAGQTSLVATSVSANFEAIGYSSASAFLGSAFSSIVSNCNTEAQTLLWDSATGAFSCGADEGGGGALIEVRESSAASGINISSISFAAGHFSVAGTTEALITLDWGLGGPASLSQNEIVTGAWTFSGGASSSVGFEITTGNFGINAGPVTSARLEVGGIASISGQTLLALSTGNVGVGTATPKAKLSLVDTGAGTVSSSSFSVRSSFVTGSVASISASALTTGNALRIEANALTTGFGINLRSTGTITTGGAMLNIMNNTMTTGAVASISGTGVTSGNLLRLTGGVTTGSGILANINGLTTGFGINLRSTGTITTGGAMLNIMNNTMTTGSVASISALGLTSGRIFDIFMAASSSTQGRSGASFLQVTAGGVVTASWSSGGTLALRGRIISRGALATCTGLNAPSPGCLDYAESYPSVDGLNPGDVVAWDSTIGRVRRATAKDNVIGVISSNPAVLITGTEVRTGAAANEQIPGKSSVALAGHVPVKVSLENGPILPGDHVAPSLTQPGYAVKAVNPGMTIGTALSGIDASALPESFLIDVFVNVDYWIPDDAIESLMSGIQVGTDDDGNLLVNQTGLASRTTRAEFDTRGLEGLAAVMNQVAVLSAHIEELKTAHTPITIPTALLDMPQAVASMSAQLASQHARLGMLTEQVSSLQKPLDIAALASQSQALTFNGVVTIAGGLRVDTIRSTDDAINFMDDVIFFGRPYFTRDTGGFAVVPKGEREVQIVFDDEYLDEPVVHTALSLGDEANASIEAQTFDENVRHLISRKNAKGFTIILERPAPRDMRFNWIALAVKNPKTFVPVSLSAPDLHPMTPAPTAEPTPTDLPEQTGTPTPSPSLSETPPPEPAHSVTPPDAPTL